MPENTQGPPVPEFVERSSSDMFEMISRTLSEDGGAFGLSYHEKQPEGRWVAALEWGHEAPDSPMAGAAAYGVGSSAAEAVELMLRDAGK